MKRKLELFQDFPQSSISCDAETNLLLEKRWLMWTPLKKVFPEKSFILPPSLPCSNIFFRSRACISFSIINCNHGDFFLWLENCKNFPLNCINFALLLLYLLSFSWIIFFFCLFFFCSCSRRVVTPRGDRLFASRSSRSVICAISILGRIWSSFFLHFNFQLFHWC